MKKTLLAVAMILGCSLSGPGLPAAFATSFIERPFSETIEDAPVIVRGKTGTSYADWGKEDETGRRIYTFTELRVDEVLKGKVGSSTILMRELGGEKDGVGMHIAGASHFQSGEDVVVMLGERNAEGSYNIRGLMMGKLRVIQNEGGKEVLDGPAISPTGEESHHGPGAASPEPEWTLERLRKLIESQQSEHKEEANSAGSGGISAAAPVKPAIKDAKSAEPEKGTDQAPQLQSSSSGDSDSGGFGKTTGGIFAGILVLAILWRLRKSRR